MAETQATYREVDGVLLLDKPINITSNAALQKIKHLFAAKKAGHSGSLDPLASGMLPICLGEATKFSQYLLEANKAYQVVAELGIKTTTGDAEGEIVQQREVVVFTQQQLRTVLQKFVGTIKQIPSMYSALKHQGQPLYKLARQGIVIERKIRHVEIFSLNLQKYEQPYLHLEVHCSKGTYIRTLIDDIGATLECGAYVKSLRRLAVAPYYEQPMITFSELENNADAAERFLHLDKYLLPLDSALTAWEEVRLSEAAAFYLRRGQPVIVPYSPDSGWVRLRLNNGSFLGLGEIMHDGRIAPRRLVSTI